MSYSQVNLKKIKNKNKNNGCVAERAATKIIKIIKI